MLTPGYLNKHVGHGPDGARGRPEAELGRPCVGIQGRGATPVDPGQLGHLLAAGPAGGARAVPRDTQGIRQGNQGGVEEGAAQRLREA